MSENPGAALERVQLRIREDLSRRIAADINATLWAPLFREAISGILCATTEDLDRMEPETRALAAEYSDDPDYHELIVAIDARRRELAVPLAEYKRLRGEK